MILNVWSVSIRFMLFLPLLVLVACGTSTAQSNAPGSDSSSSTTPPSLSQPATDDTPIPAQDDSSSTPQPAEETSLPPTSAPASTPSPGDTSDDGDSPQELKMIIKQARVNDIEIKLLESMPVQVLVTAYGDLPDGCTSIHETTSDQVDHTFNVTITTKRPADVMCTTALVPFEHNVSLDVVGLDAGTYMVNVNGITDTFTLEVDNVLPGSGESSGT